VSRQAIHGPRLGRLGVQRRERPSDDGVSQAGEPTGLRRGEGFGVSAHRLDEQTQSVSEQPDRTFTTPTHRRANALAERLEQGARALAGLADTLSEAQWQTPVPGDGRKVGVLVHHVASMYPLEIQLAQMLAGGQAIAGVTWDAVHAINAKHASEHDAVTRQEALDLLRRNGTAAAAAVRALTDEELDRAAPVSLNADAPLTCQFFIEDHALRHSYHHLARIRLALATS
jgi:DinB superfamily